MKPAPPEDIRKDLAKILVDFELGTAQGNPQFHGMNVAPSALPVPQLVPVILGILGFEVSGHDEKVAWTVYFLFEGNSCRISHEKFGLRLYLDEAWSEGDLLDVAGRIESKIRSAVRLYERKVAIPAAEERFRDGHFMLVNQFHRLHGMDDYFRERCRRAGESLPTNRGPTDDETFLAIAAPMNELFRRERERRFNGIAAVNAFFSCLEHTLVLLLSFRTEHPNSDLLLSSIGDKWGNKFKTVYEIGVDKEAKKVYDRLVAIAEDLRNTYSHGAFGKKGGTIYVSVPQMGLVPLILSRVTESPHLDFWQVQDEFDSVFEFFESCENWMRTGSTEAGMKFIDSGLDIPFDPDSRKEIAEAVRQGTLNELIETWCYLSDQATNMDW